MVDPNSELGLAVDVESRVGIDLRDATPELCHKLLDLMTKSDMTRSEALLYLARSSMVEVQPEVA